MPVTEAQFHQLIDFTKKKGVHFYDLQMELADHLANDIDSQMESKPELQFETALLNAYQKFGIQGFTNVIRDHKAATKKENARLHKLFTKEIFSWPSIAIFLTYAALMYWVMKEFLDLAVKVYILLGFVMAYQSTSWDNKVKRLKKKISFNYTIIPGAFIYIIIGANLLTVFTVNPAKELPIQFWLNYAALVYAGYFALLMYKYHKHIQQKIETEFPEILA